MKIRVSLLVALCISGIMNAQTVADKIFEKYAGSEGFTTVYITKYMFDLFRSAEVNQGNDEEMARVLNNLNSIKILTTDNDPETPVKVNLYQEVMKQLPGNLYKELMIIKEPDQEVKFLVREEKGKVVELLMLIGGRDESVMITIQGLIDMKSIGKLAQGMHLEGMENLEKINE